MDSGDLDTDDVESDDRQELVRQRAGVSGERNNNGYPRHCTVYANSEAGLSRDESRNNAVTLDGSGIEDAIQGPKDQIRLIVVHQKQLQKVADLLVRKFDEGQSRSG